MRNVVLFGHPDMERLEILVDGLSARGFHCLMAKTGSEALESAARYGPQLAVLYVGLPEVEGTDVCLRLKQEAATDKIAVLLVGEDSDEERFVGKEVGADAFIVEPDDDDVLFERIRDLFSQLVLNAR